MAIDRDLSRTLGLAGVLLGGAVLADLLSSPAETVVIDIIGVPGVGQALLVVGIAGISGVQLPAAPSGIIPALNTVSAVPDTSLPIPTGFGRLRVSVACVDPQSLQPAPCAAQIRFALQAAGEDVVATSMSRDATGTSWADCPAGTWLLIAGGSARVPTPTSPNTDGLAPVVVTALDIVPGIAQGFEVIAAVE